MFFQKIVKFQGGLYDLPYLEGAAHGIKWDVFFLFCFVFLFFLAGGGSIYDVQYYCLVYLRQKNAL